MKVICVLFLTAISNALAHSEDWELFKLSHGKEYETAAEEEYRMEIFNENQGIIQSHNERYSRGLVSFSMKMNRFGDLTVDEFTSLMNKLRSANIDVGTAFVPSEGELPDSVDWREKGAVTGVKDQGECGSCWAFSTTGSLEAQHFLSTGDLVSLSEQQLVDCSQQYGNHGCEGGLMNQAFIYINAIGGIETEQLYPYQAADATCRFQQTDVVATVTGVINIPSGDEDSLQNALVTAGPVSVSIDAGHQSFQFYGGGVYYEANCSSRYMNHGVLTVGYGTDGGQDFWLVKNSWGSEWGEAGYVKMSRSRGNNCGIATGASYPKV